MSTDTSNEYTYLFGGSIDHGKLCLSVDGDALIPEEITALLHVSPTESYRKGDPHRIPGRTRATGSWDFWTSDMSFHEKFLDERIDDFLALFPSDPAVWESLSSRYNVVLHVVCFMKTWNREFNFPRALVKKLALHCVDIWFDIYDDREEEPNKAPDSTRAAERGVDSHALPING